MKPLYMWAGGKGRMIKHYTEELSKIGDVHTFVEPFFGGGAMTIHMHDNFPQIERFVINDIKTEIMDIYRSIKDDYDRFLKILNVYDREYMKLDKAGRKEYFYEVRRMHAYDYGNFGKTHETAMLYFLMRTCFNGIWQINNNTNGRFGTPCGLLNQKECVYEKDNLDSWHEFLQKADLYDGDWKTVSEKYVGDGTFFFFDPPYRDCFTQYGSEFNDDQQVELLDFCKGVSGTAKVFLTNRDSGDDFFQSRVGDDLKIKTIPVTYTAGRRKQTEDGFAAKKATEVLICNKTL